MRTDFKFLNLCGGVYSQGNLLFANSGKELISPVGNRVMNYDLVKSANKASTFETLKDVMCMDLTPDETLLVMVDVDGRALFVNFVAGVGLEVINLKPGTRLVKFSPDGRYLAVANGRQIQVWSTPPNRVLQYRSVHLLKRINVCSGDVAALKWSKCSRYLLVSSEDCAVRIIPLRKPAQAAKENSVYVKPHVTLAVHKCPVIDAFWADDAGTTIYSAAADRVLAVWKMTDRDRICDAETFKKKQVGEYDHSADDAKKPLPGWGNGEEDEDAEYEECEEEEEGEEEEEEETTARPSAPDLTAKNWQVKKKLFLEHDARLQTCAFHQQRGLFFAGFKNGVFGVYTTIPDVKCIHTLSISEQKISSVAINPTGEWVAFGSSKLGQLLVWEWKSETYILKQQSHYYDVTTVGFSPDGAVLATSSDDGKVKLWNGSTGFCYATFRDHQGPVAELRFANNTTLWSASADGTVRGYDLRRYRQFRILQPPVAAQLSCLALDPSGEIVIAGSLTEPDVYMWNAQTGQLVEVFSGHDGPVSCVDFHSSGTVFASASWDKTIRICDIYSAGADKTAAAKAVNSEALRFNSEVVSLKFSPDGMRLAVLTLSGDLAMYNAEDTSDVTPLTTISTHRDVKGGWRSAEATNPFKGVNNGRFFKSISWSPDSQCVLLGGNSKWVTVYSAAQSFLLEKFSVTNNRTFDGMSDVYDYKASTEAGNVHNLDMVDSDDEDAARKVVRLPGAQKGDQGKRKNTRPIARANAVVWSPTGKEWAAATTDGLLLYSTETDSQRFNPISLSLGLTPMDVYGELEKGNHVLALLKALRLNDAVVLQRTFYGIPPQEVPFVSDNLPTDMLVPLLDVLSRELHANHQIERCLRWACHLMNRHGKYIQKKATATTSGAPADGQLQASLKLLHSQVVKRTLDLMKLTEQNKHTLGFLDATSTLAWKVREEAKPPQEAEDSTLHIPQLGHAARAAAANGDAANGDAASASEAEDDMDDEVEAAATPPAAPVAEPEDEAPKAAGKKRKLVAKGSAKKVVKKKAKRAA